MSHRLRKFYMHNGRMVHRILYGLARRYLNFTGHVISRVEIDCPPYFIYNQDGLLTIHNCEFMLDNKFVEAYSRGIKAAGTDFRWCWRVHVGLWAASMAQKVRGDFVECGVGNGFLSSAIMRYLDWNSLCKMFYLVDTFEGIPVTADDQAALEIQANNETMMRTRRYADSFASVVENFSEWDNVKIVKGIVPDILEKIDASEVAYLHIDMNNPTPEVAAMDFFWDKITPGGVALFDDYAYKGSREQKKALDSCLRAKNVPILTLPTGQGLVLKPNATVR